MSASWLKRAGVDRPVGMALLNSGWAAFSGPLTLLLLIHFLSLAQQGFYYTFNNFLSAALVFELGLSYVILQFASHERAKLEWTPAGTLDGDPSAKARLSALLRFSLLWYGMVALLMLLVLLPAGLRFFAHYERTHGHIAWRGAWCLVACGAAGQMLLTPLLALLEGCGLVAEIWSLRASLNVATSLVLWTVLFLHGGLYAAGAVGLTWTVGIAGWLWRRKQPFLRDLLMQRAAAHSGVFHWREEFWPFQWKVALTSLSAFLIFSALPLILFAARGEEAAGQLGLSLVLVATLFNFPQAWLNTKMQPFGVLIAQRRWQDLDRLFFPTLWRSWGLAALAGAALWLAVAFVHHQGYPLAHRLLRPLPMGLLVAASIISQGVSAEGLYLRAHKREPFVWLSLAVAGVIGLGDFLVARPYGATGMMLNYFLVYLTVGLGGGTWIFVQKRRLWHGPENEESLSEPLKSLDSA